MPSSPVGRFPPGIRMSVPSGQEAMCIPQPVSTLCPCRNSKPDFFPVAILPEKDLIVSTRQKTKLGPRYCLQAPNESGFEIRTSGRRASSPVPVVSKLFRLPLSSDSSITTQLMVSIICKQVGKGGRCPSGQNKITFQNSFLQFYTARLTGLWGLSVTIPTICSKTYLPHGMYVFRSTLG